MVKQRQTKRIRRDSEASADAEPQLGSTQSSVSRSALKQSLQSLSLDELLLLIDSFEPEASAKVEAEAGRGRLAAQRQLPDAARRIPFSASTVTNGFSSASLGGSSFSTGATGGTSRPDGLTNSQLVESLGIGANVGLPNPGLTSQALRILRTGQSFEQGSLQQGGQQQSSSPGMSQSSAISKGIFEQQSGSSIIDGLFREVKISSKTPIGGSVLDLEDIQRSPGRLQVNPSLDANANSKQPGATILNTFGSNINSGLRNSFTDPRLGNNLILNSNSGLSSLQSTRLPSSTGQTAAGGLLASSQTLSTGLNRVNPALGLSQLQRPSSSVTGISGPLNINVAQRLLPGTTFSSHPAQRAQSSTQLSGLFSDPSLNFQRFNGKRQLEDFDVEANEEDAQPMMPSIPALGADFNTDVASSSPPGSPGDEPIKISQSDALAEVLRRIEMLEKEAGASLGDVLHPKIKSDTAGDPSSLGGKIPFVFPQTVAHLPKHPRIIPVSEVPPLAPVYPDQFHDVLQLTPVKPPPYVAKKPPAPHYATVGGPLHPLEEKHPHHPESHPHQPPHRSYHKPHPPKPHHHKKHYKPVVTKVTNSCDTKMTIRYFLHLVFNRTNSFLV